MFVAAMIGFEQFYFHGRSFPGREITPPIRSLVITHGVSMALWIVLVVVQPMLVATGNRKVHMRIGRVGAALAASVVIIGLMVGVSSARVTPPDARLFGFAPREFMAVPVLSMIVFGALVGVGVWKRRTPALHRAMMHSATLATLSAALNRIPALNALYEGTFWDRLFGPFFFSSVLALAFLGVRCVLIRGIDRWLALGTAAVIAAGLAIVQIARTPAWNALATVLVPGS
jgi:uncharacterized membrane protein YozB (DUF420 family)